MSENVSLLGRKVQIVIDEDGTLNPPVLPQATIVRLMGKAFAAYWIVRLDHPIKSLRAKTGEEWTLLNLLISPAVEGASLERVFYKVDATGSPPTLWVMIGNVSVLQPDDPMVDLSKVEYFAKGLLKRVPD